MNGDNTAMQVAVKVSITVFVFRMRFVSEKKQIISGFFFHACGIDASGNLF